MTHIDPNFSIPNGIRPPHQEVLTPGQDVQLNFIHDQLVSMNRQMDETLAYCRTKENTPSRSACQAFKQLIADCCQWVRSLFT